MKNRDNYGEEIVLPKNLSFAASSNCYNCKWMNGGEGSKIWCDYYKGYYDPCYCDHFCSK